MNHCHRWQSAMAVLSFTLGLLMIIAGVRQLLHPWDLQHHAFFNGAHLPSAICFPLVAMLRASLICVQLSVAF